MASPKPSSGLRSTDSDSKKASSRPSSKPSSTEKIERHDKKHSGGKSHGSLRKTKRENNGTETKSEKIETNHEPKESKSKESKDKEPKEETNHKPTKDSTKDTKHLEPPKEPEKPVPSTPRDTLAFLAGDGQFKSQSSSRRVFNPNVDKTEAKRQRLEKLFKKTDTDGSGFLEADELRQLFKETFQKDDLNFDEGGLLKYAKLQISKLAADQNAQGISFDEFVVLYEKILADPDIPEELKAAAKNRDKEKALKAATKLRETDEATGAVFVYESSPEVIAVEKKIKTIDGDILRLKDLIKERDEQLASIEEKKKVRRERLLALFKGADSDGNGTLDLDELTGLLVQSFQLQNAELIIPYAKSQMGLVSSSGTVTFEQFQVVYENILEDPAIPLELKAGATRAEKVLKETKEQQARKTELVSKATQIKYIVEANVPHQVIPDFSNISNPSVLAKGDKDSRDRTVIEILRTEQGYVAGLKIIIKVRLKERNKLEKEGTKEKQKQDKLQRKKEKKKRCNKGMIKKMLKKKIKKRDEKEQNEKEPKGKEKENQKEK